MTILGPLAEKVEKNISILHTFSEDKKVFHFIILPLYIFACYIKCEL